MYSKSLRCSCRLHCYKSAINKYIYHHSYHSLATSNTYCHHPYNSTLKHKCIRSFSSKQHDDEKQHDDSYLELDEIEEEEHEPEYTKSRKWKSSQAKKHKIESESTSEPTVKPSRWHSIKSTINKPFAAIKSKVSRKKKTDDETETKSIKKEKMVHRPGKKSLPSPDQGVMTFIPKHKAQILHILQEECNIFPDEVFPLFPDHKTEDVLAHAEDWFGEGIQFMDDEQATQTYLDKDESDDEEEDEERYKYIDDTEQHKEEPLLLSNEGKQSDDSLIKVDMTQMKEMTVSDIMSDKPRTTASKLRSQKVSGIGIDDERSKVRELSFMNPYKYRDIMTPQEVKELYTEREEREEIRETEEEIRGTHDIWHQEPDNVYDIIQLLREMGFKTNQTGSVWPYTELNELETEDETKTEVKRGEETKEIVVSDGGGFNPLPDTFNDFYLLFARFPELLSMEITDIRRKIHVLEQFQIDDVRILLLKDPRVLRRPSHHIRWFLEVFDDYFVDDFTQIIELSPHFLASTSKKEVLKRLCFIHREILQPHQEYEKQQTIDTNLNHLDKNSQFIIKRGKVIQKDHNIENEMVNGIYLDDVDKENLSDFIVKHPDFIGNCNVNRMNEILWKLKKLGIKHKKLNDLLYEYPQLLTISPQALHECIDRIKMNGIRDYRQYMIDNIHDVLTFSSPVDRIVITDEDEAPQNEQIQAM